MTAVAQQHSHQRHHPARRPKESAKDSATTSASREGGPISKLQEFVQSDRRFPVASHRPILSWDFDTRMANALTLEFRATVSFMLEGTPHHAAGCWQSSKKAAQRDAAERILVLLTGHWADYSSKKEAAEAAANLHCRDEAAASDRLSAFCKTLLGSSHDDDALRWRCQRTVGGYQAHVDVNLFGGITHTLQGAVCDTEAAAREDTACRALWYLRCPGYEDTFKVTAEAVAAETLPLPAQSEWRREGWGAESDASSEAQQRAAEQKTLIMRIQNRLQRAYAKELPSGVSVWDWSYDYSSGMDAVVPLCRARVKVAKLDREFSSQWCRGQKSAQLEACNRIAEFLDALEQEDRSCKL